MLWFLPSTQAGYWGKEPPGAFWDRGVGQHVAVPGWCLIKQNRCQMEDFLPSPSHFFPSFCSTPRLLLDLGGLHCLVVLELTCLNNKSTLLDRIKQTIRKSINQLVSAAGRGQGRAPPSSRPHFPTSKPAAAQAAGSSELRWLPFQGLEAGTNPGRKEQGGSVGEHESPSQLEMRGLGGVASGSWSCWHPTGR